MGDQTTKKKFLNLATEIESAYRAVLPDPLADNYYGEVTAIRVIASRIRHVGLASADVSQVKKDLEDLLDRSIQAGEYVIAQHKKLRDLSALNPDDTTKVRLVSKELLEKLKEKLVPGWRDFEPLRAGVKIAISESIYTEKDCEYKGMEIYNFVYERYADARVYVGA